MSGLTREVHNSTRVHAVECKVSYDDVGNYIVQAVECKVIYDIVIIYTVHTVKCNIFRPAMMRSRR